MVEQREKIYSVSSYFLSKVIVEIPVALVMPAIFTSVIYFGIGLTITVK